MWLVTKVKTDSWDLIVYFNDGAVKKMDIREYLSDFSSPSADRIKKDMDFFHKVKNEDGVALTWPTGFCIDSDDIHDLGIDVKKAASSLHAKTSLIAALKKLIG